MKYHLYLSMLLIVFASTCITLAQPTVVKVGENLGSGAVLTVSKSILKRAFEVGLNDGTTMMDLRLRDSLGVRSIQCWGKRDSTSDTLAITLIDSTDDLGIPSLFVTVGGSDWNSCCKDWDCNLCHHCEVNWYVDLSGTKHFDGCNCYLSGEGPCIKFCDVCYLQFALTSFISEVSTWL